MKKTSLFLGIGVALLLSACNSSDDGGGNKPNPNNGNDGSAKYVLAVKSFASSDKNKADYLLTSKDISKGELNLSGNGLEQDGTFRYYLTTDNKFYSFLYGRNEQSALDTYSLNKNGELTEGTKTNIETMQVFTPIKNDIFMISESRSASSKLAKWFRYDTKSSQIVSEGEINTEELANKPNGEFAFFTWANLFDNNKILLPYMNIEGVGFPGFGTSYPDEAEIAIYSYPEMKLQKIIRDDRISTIGKYLTNAISVDEKGDAYAFSPSARFAVNKDRSKRILSTKPSAIVRIKKGTMAFDNNYFFNIKEATNGEYYLANKIYAKNGKMLGFFRKTGKIDVFTPGRKLGIVDLYNKTITWVSGVPNEDNVMFSSGQQSYLTKDKNNVILGITTNDGECYIYNININKATATKGLKVIGGGVTAVGMLISQ